MIYFVGGFGKGDKLLAVAIGFSEEPELEVERLREFAPFEVRLVAVEEEGSLERLEGLKREFQHSKMQGPWYRVSDALRAHLAALPPPSVPKRTKRISLDVTLKEFQRIESTRKLLGDSTKVKLIRRAVRFFLRIAELKNQGFAIQAIRGGTLYQFHDLDQDPVKPGATPK